MNHAHDVLIERTASISTFGGSGAMVVGGITANEIAAIGGLFVGLVGLAVSWYYKHKADQRDELMHRVKLQELTNQSAAGQEMTSDDEPTSFT